MSWIKKLLLFAQRVSRRTWVAINAFWRYKFIPFWRYKLIPVFLTIKHGVTTSAFFIKLKYWGYAACLTTSKHIKTIMASPHYLKTKQWAVAKAAMIIVWCGTISKKLYDGYLILQQKIMASQFPARLMALKNKSVNRCAKLLTQFRLKLFFLKNDLAEKKTVQQLIVYYEKIKTRMHRFFTQSPLMKQLDEASQPSVRSSTLISTFFINLLSLAFPLTLMQVYDRIIPNHSYSTLVILSLGVSFALIFEVLLRVARSYINLWADTKYEYHLSKTAFNNLIDVPLYVYEETDAGTRLKQFTILNQLRGFYNNQLLSALCDAPFLIIFFLVIAYIAGWLFLVPLLVSVLAAYTSFRFIHYWQNFLEKKITHESKESDFFVNILTNIHTVKSLGMEDLILRRYEKLQKKAITINYQSSVQAGDLTTLKISFNQLVIILTATLGALAVIHGTLAVGGLGACILLVGRIMQPVNRILNAFNQWKMLGIVRKQLDAVLQLPVEQKAYLSGFDEVQGEITFKDLSFYYEDKQARWILNTINLTIPPRTVVAITGQDQPAKTALLNILATISKPTSGEYLLDGNNVDHYQSYALREKIAYLSKTGKLFRGTIMENLSAFNETLIPTARRFCEVLELNKIIAKLPNGFDTMVGDKAVEALPGGVVNLIFIIRALVNKPKIVLFDEANMNLDTQFTKKMIELLALLKDVSTIIILVKTEATLALANVVYDLKEGKLEKIEHGK